MAVLTTDSALPAFEADLSQTFSREKPMPKVEQVQAVEINGNVVPEITIVKDTAEETKDV